MTRDELIERARQLIDDEVLTRTGRSVGDLASGHVARALADEGLLADPARVRPMVLLRAEDCDCTPPYADCPHGPEPVDALALALWLHAEAKFFGEGWHNQWMSTRETVHKLQARLNRVSAVLNREWPDHEDHHDFVNQQVEDARAALQGDQPAQAASFAPVEPHHLIDDALPLTDRARMWLEGQSTEDGPHEAQELRAAADWPAEPVDTPAPGDHS